VCSIAIIPTFWLLACLLVLLGRLLRSLVVTHIRRHYFFLSPGLVQEQSDTLEPCSREDASSSTLRFASVKLLFALAHSLIAVACLALIVAFLVGASVPSCVPRCSSNEKHDGEQHTVVCLPPHWHGLHQCTTKKIALCELHKVRGNYWLGRAIKETYMQFATNFSSSRASWTDRLIVSFFIVKLTATLTTFLVSQLE
jgi:hypothetical protein